MELDPRIKNWGLGGSDESQVIYAGTARRTISIRSGSGKVDIAFKTSTRDRSLTLLEKNVASVHAFFVELKPHSGTAASGAWWFESAFGGVGEGSDDGSSLE